MENAVTRLEQRLAQGGGKDGDWELLAKSYEFMNRPADAALARSKKLPAGAGTASSASNAALNVATPVVAAPAKPLSPEAAKLKAAADAARLKRDFAAAKASYQKLAARHEMTADTWADYADSAGTLNGGKLAGEPEGMIRQALALDPNHPKALWLQASADEEAGRYAQAVANWQRLSTLVPPGGPDAQAVAAKLAEDQRLAGGAAGTATPTAPAGSGVAVQGQVTVADALRGKIPAGLTLFIVAKSVQSPGPPVAILRLTTGTWPVAFRLDDSQSMIPGRSLSSAGTVTIEARTSRSGQAMPQPGDFQGVLGPLDPKGKGAGKPLRLVIDKVVG
jgi:cytochrome c-type biogenesis protein CcmH